VTECKQSLSDSHYDLALNIKTKLQIKNQFVHHLTILRNNFDIRYSMRSLFEKKLRCWISIYKKNKLIEDKNKTKFVFIFFLVAHYSPSRYISLCVNVNEKNEREKKRTFFLFFCDFLPRTTAATSTHGSMIPACWECWGNSSPKRSARRIYWMIDRFRKRKVALLWW